MPLVLLFSCEHAVFSMLDVKMVFEEYDSPVLN